MTLSVTLPTKAYLKQYVLFRHNTKEALNLSSKGEITLVLRTLLEGKRMNMRPIPNEYELDEKNFDTSIQLIVPKTESRWGRIVITDEVVMFANQFIRMSFLEFIIHRIHFNKQHGVSAKDTILSTLEEIGISEMINDESVIKATYRLRSARGLEKF